MYITRTSKHDVSLRYFRVEAQLTEHFLCRVARKHVFVFSDRIRHKPDCTTTEDGKRHEISDLGMRGIVPSMTAKTKALISYAQLICAFVFAYAKIGSSHDATHIRVVF